MREVSRSTAVGLVMAMAFFVSATQAFAAGNTNDTIGDAVSDQLMGNEPNIIPFTAGNLGPAEQDPGSIGDLGGNSGNPNSVEPSGAPGPITCGGNWVGMPLVLEVTTDTSVPGNSSAPGLIVDCASGDGKPHVP